MKKNEIKRIAVGADRCPYCNSKDIKKYLYGEPSYDYDKDKYVLGGCEVGFGKPQYKCINCGKDLYLEKTKPIPGIIIPDLNDCYDVFIDKKE